MKTDIDVPQILYVLCLRCGRRPASAGAIESRSTTSASRHTADSSCLRRGCASLRCAHSFSIARRPATAGAPRSRASTASRTILTFCLPCRTDIKFKIRVLSESGWIEAPGPWKHHLRRHQSGSAASLLRLVDAQARTRAEWTNESESKNLTVANIKVE